MNNNEFTPKEETLKTKVLNVLLNLAGSSLLAFAVCAFIVPFDLIVGGATGISLVLNKLTGINVSVFAMAINLIVLVPGLIFGGKKLVLGSVLSSVFYPLALGVFERIPSITTLADSASLAMICGGVVGGVGIGLVMRSGGSTGGLDIPVLLIHKYTRLPVNYIMNATDGIIMLCQIPFSVVTNVLYGLIYTFIMTYSLNTVLTFGSGRIKVTVISEQFEEICAALSANDFGVTMIFGEGGYTKTPIKKIESIMISERYRTALRIIEEIDPTSFITVENVRDVKGRGYTLAQERIEM